MQKKFARIHVETSYGSKHLTNTEVAIKLATPQSQPIRERMSCLHPRHCPHVVNILDS
jgi:hypothetical protein